MDRYKEVTINIVEKEEYVYIVLAGDLEYEIIEDVKKEINIQNFKTDHDYMIDMKRVTNIDSTGFGMIVNFAKKVAVKGKKIVIILEDEFIKNLFAISQCDKVFPIVATEAEAYQVIKVADWSGVLSINEY